jgi:hypothetical protein
MANASTNPAHSLPLSRRPTLLALGSLLIALLADVLALAGLLTGDAVYQSEELRDSFVTNDLVNLAIGVPILLIALWMARRGSLTGLLFWPGALFFLLYNAAIVYVYALPLGWAWLLYLVLLALIVYTLIGLMASIDGSAVRSRLQGKVPERLAGGVMVGLGAVFLLFVIGEVASAVASQTPVARAQLAVHVADFVTIPAWIIGGVLLWRRQPLGYVSGAGLLFGASMLFVGLLVYFLVQPTLTDAPFATSDFVAVLAFGLVCFVPFGLFLRGLRGA